MALQKREKKMLIGLGVVAVISAVILYRVFNPAAPDPIEQITTTAKEVVEEATSSRSAPRGGGGGGSRGGGGGSSTASSQGASISSSEYQKHALPNDCWVVMDDAVFDVSGVINEYSQYADGISQFCGTFGFEAGFLSENSDLKLIIESRGTRKGAIN